MSAPEFYYCDGSIISRVDRAPTEDDTLRAAAQAALEALLVALGYELRTLPLPTSVLTEEDAKEFSRLQAEVEELQRQLENSWSRNKKLQESLERELARKKPINTDEALRARLAEVTQLSERQANDITLMRTKLARLELVEEAMVTKIATELRDPVAELERELDDIDIDMEGDTIASLGRRSE